MKETIFATLMLATFAIGCATPAKPKPPKPLVLRFVATTSSKATAITTVILKKDQSLFVNGQPVELGQLAQRLESVTSDKSSPVILQADPATPYPAVAGVVELLTRAGYTNLAVAVNKASAIKKKK